MVQSDAHCAASSFWRMWSSPLVESQCQQVLSGLGGKVFGGQAIPTSLHLPSKVLVHHQQGSRPLLIRGHQTSGREDRGESEDRLCCSMDLQHESVGFGRTLCR